jgi:hypothetical protein
MDNYKRLMVLNLEKMSKEELNALRKLGLT